MKLFSGSANRPLAVKVAKALKMKLSPVDIHIFPDGERRIQIPEKVVDEHCVVIQSASAPVDTNYMELFFIVDALKRSGAEFVTAVVPYFGYQRQDHVFRDGEAVSLEVMIKMLESVGVDRLISLDMHSVRIPDLFNIPVTHLSALPIFAEKIRSLVIPNSNPRHPELARLAARQDSGSQEIADQVRNDGMRDTILISPDEGGIARVKKLSGLLKNMPYATIEKNRDLVTGVVTADGIEEGSVKGKKRAFIIDDMISSGGTMILAAQTLKKQGISEMYVFATHPVFSLDGPSKLQASAIKKIYVTNSVFVPSDKMFGKLRQLSIAEIIANELKKL